MATISKIWHVSGRGKEISQISVFWGTFSCSWFWLPTLHNTPLLWIRGMKQQTLYYDRGFCGSGFGWNPMGRACLCAPMSGNPELRVPAVAENKSYEAFSLLCLALGMSWLDDLKLLSPEHSHVACASWGREGRLRESIPGEPIEVHAFDDLASKIHCALLLEVSQACADIREGTWMSPLDGWSGKVFAALLWKATQQGQL